MLGLKHIVKISVRVEKTEFLNPSFIINLSCIMYVYKPLGGVKISVKIKKAITVSQSKMLIKY